jgi:hypothetical protein
MPQDFEGRLNTLWATEFTWEEVDYYIGLGGVVGGAARAVKSFPFLLTLGVLAQLIPLSKAMTLP